MPASLLIRAPPEPSVIVPDQALSLARFLIAPAVETPVPMRLVIGSAMARAEPSISIIAPEATLEPVPVPPSALLD